MIESPKTVFETFAKGKFLLTGEYFVLLGAAGLALPLPFGQRLRAQERKKGRPELQWTALGHDQKPWFDAVFHLDNFEILETNDAKAAGLLKTLLTLCRSKNPAFLLEETAVETHNNFPRAWGLGTSSTLIAALGRWAGVDPWFLLDHSLGGSGYDIACAYAESEALFYQRMPGGTPEIRPIEYQPSFSRQLYFVYLGQKQQTASAIRRFREKNEISPVLVEKISLFAKKWISASDTPALCALIREHETLISESLELKRAKDLHFPDFPGEIKSLGAWGGDFVLAASLLPEAEVHNYFSLKGLRAYGWTEFVSGQILLTE